MVHHQVWQHLESTFHVINSGGHLSLLLYGDYGFMDLWEEDLERK